ncbi:MAG: DUF2141 domain-containing protein [Sulfurovum sp.]|nr:MAG: DUF2141 domain-containing protein [Sulfurovum sp.]
MQKIVSTFLLLTIALLSSDITVKVIGLKSEKGTIGLGLFNTDQYFLKEKGKYKKAQVKITKDGTFYTFKNIPKGVYAITVYHDENANGKLDKNFIGFPKEGVGISNDAKGSFGPPTFKDAKFVLKKHKTITIRVNY